MSWQAYSNQPYSAQCKAANCRHSMIYMYYNKSLCFKIIIQFHNSMQTPCSFKVIVTAWYSLHLLSSTGAVVHYFLLQCVIWFFFYTCSIFYKVVFPIHYKGMENNSLKCIHMSLIFAGMYLACRFTIVTAIISSMLSMFTHIHTQTCTGIFLPVPAVVMSLTHDGYALLHFPPQICVSKNQDMWFYSAMFPIDIMMAIMTSMFLVILWVVHKVFCFINSLLLFIN